MPLRYKLLLSLSGFVLLLFIVSRSSVLADELPLLNRPVNTDGLTGLLFTAAPYTLPSGTVEAGIAAISITNDKPEYKIIEYPVTLSFGLPHNVEVSLKGSYADVNDSSSGSQVITHESGDAVLSLKWNFIQQKDDSAAPAWALLISGTLPSNRRPDARINSASHWGARLGIAAGSELQWRNHILDVYVDANLAGRDPADSEKRDVYWEVNSGLLFPISKYQNLQALIEYTVVGGKDAVSNIGGGNYSAMTYGLRLVNERFNLTIGTQLIHDKIQGPYEKTIGLMSIKY